MCKEQTGSVPKGSFNVLGPSRHIKLESFGHNRELLRQLLVSYLVKKYVSDGDEEGINITDAKKMSESIQKFEVILDFESMGLPVKKMLMFF